MNQVELTFTGSLLAPGRQKFAVLGELDDPRVAVSIRNIEVTVGCEGDVGGTIEEIICLPLQVLPAEHHANFPLSVHLHNDMPIVVRGPQITVGVKFKPMRANPDAITPGSDQGSCLIELDQRMWAAVEDEDVFPLVDSDTGRFLECPSGGEAGLRRIDGVRKLGPFLLAESKKSQTQQECGSAQARLCHRRWLKSYQRNLKPVGPPPSTRRIDAQEDRHARVQTYFDAASGGGRVR